MRYAVFIFGFLFVSTPGFGKQSQYTLRLLKLGFQLAQIEYPNGCQIRPGLIPCIPSQCCCQNPDTKRDCCRSNPENKSCADLCKEAPAC